MSRFARPSASSSATPRGISALSPGSPMPGATRTSARQPRWPGRTEAPSPSARHIRLRDVVHLARFLHAEDAGPRGAASSPVSRSKGAPSALHLRARGGGADRRGRRPTATDIPTPARGVHDTLRTDRRNGAARLGGARPAVRRSAARRRSADPSGRSSARAALSPCIPRWRKRSTATSIGAARLAVTDDHVFLSAGNRRIAASMVNYTFRRVVRLAGVAAERTRPCRIHDLRHTFATRSLQQCSTRRASRSPVTSSRWRPTWDTRTSSIPTGTWRRRRS